MRIRRRILSVLLVLGLVLGLPVQAAPMTWNVGTDGAMAADGMALNENCRHCDPGEAIAVMACQAVCFALPVLLSQEVAKPIPTPLARPMVRASDLFPGQPSAPDPGPPRTFRII